MSLTLRRMRRGEAPALYALMRRAVHRGTTAHYDRAQRRAWAPDRQPVSWEVRLAAQQVFVAESGGAPVAFMTVTEEGEIDLAYTAPEHIGHGLGSQLLARIETELGFSDVTEMSVAASLAARGFFARHGFETLREETVYRNGAALPRVLMRKRLA